MTDTSTDTAGAFDMGVDLNRLVAEYTQAQRKQYEQEQGIQPDPVEPSSGRIEAARRSDSVASSTGGYRRSLNSSPAINPEARSARQSVVYELIPPPPESFLVDTDKLKNAPAPIDRAFAWPESITETEVRDALSREVKKHSMWKTAAVKKLEIADITCLTALHYTLETFTETRSTTSCTEAYSVGQYMEHSAAEVFSAVTLDPWDVDCVPNAEFTEENRMFEMPHTTQLNVCKTCNAEGAYHCFHCSGSGSDKCQYCRGTGMKTGIAHPAVYTHPLVATYPHNGQARGYFQGGSSLAGGAGHNPMNPVLNRRGFGPGSGVNNALSYGMGTPVHFMSVSGIPPPGISQHDICFFCHGRGVRECSHCKGQGKKSCSACGGSGSVRTFTKLKIRYAVERAEFYHDNGLPEKFLRDVSGEIVLAECGPYVLPLRNYPVEEVNDQSKRLCQIHLQKCMGSSRILQQRHTLEAVPVAQVTYIMNGKEGVFWVYGHERRCYVPKYPAKCCIL